MKVTVREKNISGGRKSLYLDFCIDRTDSEHTFGDMVDTFKDIYPSIHRRDHDAFQGVYHYVSTP